MLRRASTSGERARTTRVGRATRVGSVRPPSARSAIPSKLGTRMVGSRLPCLRVDYRMVKTWRALMPPRSTRLGRSNRLSMLDRLLISMAKSSSSTTLTQFLERTIKRWRRERLAFHPSPSVLPNSQSFNESKAPPRLPSIARSNSRTESKN